MGCDIDIEDGTMIVIVEDKTLSGCTRKAAARRADGDFKHRWREKGSTRTINGEPECVQGQGQGLAKQWQDDGANDK